MKYAREIKVAVLVIVCAFLVYFGLNYLKGVNVFSQDNHYVGIFENVSGLKEQAPVYVRGYKVGQVDRIQYDFTQKDAFTVTISMHKNILLAPSSQMRLVDDGLLGGKAIEVMVPVGTYAGQNCYANGDTLPAIVVPGLLASLQEGLWKKLDDALLNLDSLVVKVNDQIDDNTLKQTLANVERISQDLSASAHDIKKVTQKQLPQIIENADTMLIDAKQIVRDVKQADLPATIARVDQTLDTVHGILTNKEGTLGLLLNDAQLYRHIDSTVVSVDSLVNDLKKNPKKYVHFSLFGDKNKKKKSEKK